MPDASLHAISPSSADPAAERTARLIAARLTAPRMRGRAALLARAAAGDDVALEALESGSLAALDRDPLVAYLRAGGTVPVARVSSAQARGRAKRYSYWGAVEYALRWSERRMLPVLVPCGRASSDRRSERLAERDAEELAEQIGGILAQALGSTLIDRAREWLAARDERRAA